MAFRRFCSDMMWLSRFWGVESRGLGRAADAEEESEGVGCDDCDASTGLLWSLLTAEAGLGLGASRGSVDRRDGGACSMRCSWGLTATFSMSACRSQLRLSKKPSRSVVSDAEKRSAEEGSGGGVGKRLCRAGSKANVKSSNGTGGCSGGSGIGHVSSRSLGDGDFVFVFDVASVQVRPAAMPAIHRMGSAECPASPAQQGASGKAWS